MEMTEPGEFTLPLNSFEVFTFDSATKTLKKSHVFDPVDQKHNFPKRFVCKIYSDLSSVGTGFVFRALSGRPLIITALHVQKNVFCAPSQFLACFEYNQRGKDYNSQFNMLYVGTHVCESGMFKIVPTDLTPFFGMYQKDPETKQAYSIDNDITAFYLLDECICGRQKDLPALDYVDVGPVPPISTKCFLFGFPGNNISIERLIPHAPEYETMLKSEKYNLQTEALLWTKGKVVNVGDLVAIDAPCVSGFSGGPVLYKDGQTWKIFSILLGGPAIKGHIELLEIYGLICGNNFLRANEKIEALGNLFPNDVFSYLMGLFQYYYIKRPSELQQACKDSYFRLAFIFCDTKEIDKNEIVNMLNHNLCIKVQDFVRGLWI